jgi:serine/threonine-protein kinase
VRSAGRPFGVTVLACDLRFLSHDASRPAAVGEVRGGTVTRMARPAIADLAGRVLAGRYRLLGSIGAGASGRVYVADDVRLRRRVAVKVLHNALAEDAGFLRRFRSEAQHAASLHHPHIVAVYDWGEDGGLPFMVLELLQGGSLRALLDTGGRLSPAQATHLGRQVAQALHYAHTRGVVHRDIKSANLLFDEHGIVRVADFGLARALAEASWTEPDGGLMGTARYAAPEQATSGTVDGRADCYSLAVVLIESITGRVPNVGDNAVATIVGRGTQPLSVPAGLGRLGDVLTRAGQPDPNNRFPDAAAFASALSAAARELAPPAPLVLAGLGEALDDPEPTRIAAARALTEALDDSASPAVFDQDAVEVMPPMKMPRRVKAPGSHRLVPAVVATVLVLALVAVGAIVAGLSGGGGATVPAPNVVGMAEKDAIAAAAAKGLVVDVTRAPGDDVAGLVVSQRPTAGSFLSDGGTIHLVVSRGPPPVDVPDVAGKTLDDARALLEQAGFVVGEPKHQFDDVVPYNSVISSDPAGNSKAARESVVVLTVSDGPAPVKVPDVSNQTYDQAAAALGALGFKVARNDVFDDKQDVGKVVSTDPAAGQLAPKNGTITVNVSKGPELVTIPNDLIGKTVELASQELQFLGLVPDVENYAPGKKVQAVIPQPGTQVKKGSKVRLIL